MRYSQGRIAFADALAVTVDNGAAPQDAAEFAPSQPREKRFEMRVGTALHAALDQASVLFRRLDHLARFPDTVRDGLLDVDVFARFAGPYRGQSVPVVGRGDHHRIDVVRVEDTPEISDGANLLLRIVRLGALGGLRQALPVGIGHGGDAHTGHLAEGIDELHAARAHADDADAHGVIRRRARAGHRGGDRHAAREGQETTP